MLQAKIQFELAQVAKHSVHTKLLEITKSNFSTNSAKWERYVNMPMCEISIIASYHNIIFKFNLSVDLKKPKQAGVQINLFAIFILSYIAQKTRARCYNIHNHHLLDKLFVSKSTSNFENNILQIEVWTQSGLKTFTLFLG